MQIEFAVANAQRQFALQLLQRAVAVEQRLQPLQRLAFDGLAEPDFAGHQVQRVGGDPGLENRVGRQPGHQRIAQQPRDRVEDVGAVRLIQHVSGSRVRMRIKSSSFSETRRAIIARSTVWSRPLANQSSMLAQLTPQRRLPMTSQ